MVPFDARCTSTEKALSIFIVCHKLCIGRTQPHLARVNAHTHLSSAVFCAFRLYAIWDREWSVFWAIMLLYVAQSALFLVRPFPSYPRLVLIYCQGPECIIRICTPRTSVRRMYDKRGDTGDAKNYAVSLIAPALLTRTKSFPH